MAVAVAGRSKKRRVALSREVDSVFGKLIPYRECCVLLCVQVMELLQKRGRLDSGLDQEELAGGRKNNSRIPRIPSG
jgi:hypothetical protein